MIIVFLTLQAVLDIEDPHIAEKMKAMRLFWLCGEVYGRFEALRTRLRSRL